MGGILKVTIRDKEGNIKDQFCRGDLVLDNLISFMADFMFHPKTFGFPVETYSEGGSGTFDDNYWANAYILTNKYIAIGIGTTSPSAGDTALGNQVAETSDVTTTVGSDFITWAASITVNASYTITEAGLKTRYMTNKNITSPNHTTELMIRDTFSGRDVVSGDTISITFKFQV